MAKYTVALSKCSFGKKGEVVDLDGELTERQKIMLKPYKEPEVKKLTAAKKK